MRIVIEGIDLPGARFCDRDGVVFDAVHVGLQVGREPFDLVSGDAVSTRWQLDVDVVRDLDGDFDFRGPAVHGRRGERFLYLTWGRVHHGTFDMFRRAKLILSAIDPRLIAPRRRGPIPHRHSPAVRRPWRSPLRPSRRTRFDLAGRLILRE